MFDMVLHFEEMLTLNTSVCVHLSVALISNPSPVEAMASPGTPTEWPIL